VGAKREPSSAQRRLAWGSREEGDDHSARKDGAIPISSVHSRNDETLREGIEHRAERERAAKSGAAGVEIEEELVEVWMRNPAHRSAERLNGDGIAVVRYRHRAISPERDADLARLGSVLSDVTDDDLEKPRAERPTRVPGADVHHRAAPDDFQPFNDGDSVPCHESMLSRCGVVWQAVPQRIVTMTVYGTVRRFSWWWSSAIPRVVYATGRSAWSWMSRYGADLSRTGVPAAPARSRRTEHRAATERRAVTAGPASRGRAVAPDRSSQPRPPSSAPCRRSRRRRRPSSRPAAAPAASRSKRCRCRACNVDRRGAAPPRTPPPSKESGSRAARKDPSRRCQREPSAGPAPPADRREPAASASAGWCAHRCPTGPGRRPRARRTTRKLRRPSAPARARPDRARS